MLFRSVSQSRYEDYVAKEKELFDEAQRSVRAGKETFGLTPSEIQSLFKDTSVEKDYRLPMTRGNRRDFKFFYRVRPIDIYKSKYGNRSFQQASICDAGRCADTTNNEGK